MADPLQFALSIIDMKQRNAQRDAELEELKKQHAFQQQMAQSQLQLQQGAGQRDEAESAARLKKFEQDQVNATNNTLRDLMGGQTIFVPATADLSGLKEFSFKDADGKDVSINPKMVRGQMNNMEGYFVHPEGHPLANPDVQKNLRELEYHNQRSKSIAVSNVAKQARMQNDSIKLAMVLNSRTKIDDDQFRNASRVIEDAWKSVPFDKQLEGADPLTYLDGEGRRQYETAQMLRAGYLFQRNGDVDDIMSQARDLTAAFDGFRDKPLGRPGTTPITNAQAPAIPSPDLGGDIMIGQRAFKTTDEAKLYLRDEIRKAPPGSISPELLDAYTKLRGR